MQHLLYKSLTAALALTGCASLIVSGELNMLFILPGLAIFPGYYRYLTGKPAISRWLVAGLAVAEIFVLGFDAMFVSRDFLIAVAHMTIVFQALKSFDFHEPWDPLQVYFMSLLQLIITSELSLSMAVGGVFIVFLFVFMAVLVVSHFMKEGTIDRVDFKRPMFLVSVAALIFTMVFFVTIPRLKSGIWGRKAASGIRTVGFSGSVDFGSFGEILDDDTIVMRAEIKDSRDVQLYWRGSTLDRFDGVRWHDTFRETRRVERDNRVFTFGIHTGSLDELVKQEIILEPLDTEVVFGLGEIAALESKSWLVYINDAGTVKLPQKARRRYSYTVYSLTEPRLIGNERFGAVRGRYLQMPEGMERLEELAREVMAEAETDFKRARLTERFLLRQFDYSLKTSPPPTGVSALENFLFNTRTGYCQYFASAMALMLRSEGIPSRIVTGYKGGEANLVGSYVMVRQNNAHSWVEAFINGSWERFDPTPLADPFQSSGFRLTMDNIRMQWYRYVIGFSGSDQRAIVRTFNLPVLRLPEIGGFSLRLRPVHALALLAALFALLYFLGVRGAQFRGRSFESRAYMRFRLRVIRLGGRVTDSSAPHEVLKEAVANGVDPEQAAAFIRLYERARFGGRALDAGQRREYEKFTKELSGTGRGFRSS